MLLVQLLEPKWCFIYITSTHARPGDDPVAIFGEVFFRERNFSLEYRAIRPSAGFETRRKNVLRGAGYAWTLDL